MNLARSLKCDDSRSEQGLRPRIPDATCWEEMGLARVKQLDRRPPM